MLDSTSLGIAISVVSLLGGCVSWALNLKISRDIVANNQHIENGMSATKQQFIVELNTLREMLMREINMIKDRSVERAEKTEKELTELKAGLGDRVLTTVNGKYVRSELYAQGQANLTERISDLQRNLQGHVDLFRESVRRDLDSIRDRLNERKQQMKKTLMVGHQRLLTTLESGAV